MKETHLVWVFSCLKLVPLSAITRLSHLSPCRQGSRRPLGTWHSLNRLHAFFGQEAVQTLLEQVLDRGPVLELEHRDLAVVLVGEPEVDRGWLGGLSHGSVP